MTSRDRIFAKLKRAQRPFPDVEPPETYLPMVPLADTTPAGLKTRFVEMAEAAGCVVHSAETPSAALAVLRELMGEDSAVACWDPAAIPLPGLRDMLDGQGVMRVEKDASVRVGITGVDAALAATGSVVVKSGHGRGRSVSLLPPVHVAVVATSQIVADLESWWAIQRDAGLDAFRQHSNIAIITGPSRTADIAMQLVLGMHGPRELHVVLVND